MFFDSDLAKVNTTEGAAYGAALLAKVGSGCWSGVDAACQPAIRITGDVGPNSEAARQYEDIYSMYRELYPALKASFNRLGA